MRLFEITDYNSPLVRAIDNWFSLENDNNDINTILNSPEANNFKTSNSHEIYRCIVLTKSGKMKSVKSNSKFITFSEDEKVPHLFYNSLDIQNPYIVIKKRFIPNDLILNFGELSMSLGMHGGWPEKELWMKATPYYKSVNQDEIIYDSRNDK